MRLTVLGGSAAGPNTGQGCSGALLEVGTTRLVLDLGPGTLPELRRHADFRTLDAVILSHLHLDHVLDVLALRFALAYNPIPSPRRVPLWLPPGGRDFLRRAAAAFATPDGIDTFFGDVFAVDEYDPAGPLTVGAARVRFAATVHFVPCWAIRVDPIDGGAGLAYTADTGPTADLAPLATGASVLLAEATSPAGAPEPAAERGHLTAVEAGRLASTSGVSTLVLTHLWEENGVDASRRQAAAAFGGRIEIAVPGLSVTW
jgi:ribonuclease BN (tRNA processing enzyme)